MQQAGCACMGVTMKLYENRTPAVPAPATPLLLPRLDDVEDAAAWPMRWACRTMCLIIKMRFVSRS